MKKFIYKICLLLLLVILFDVVFGLVMGNKYFADGTHLNARGADEFTKDIIKELRKRKLIR